MKHKNLLQIALSALVLVMVCACNGGNEPIDPIDHSNVTCKLNNIKTSTEELLFSYNPNGTINKVNFVKDSIYLSYTYNGDSIYEYITSFAASNPYSVLQAKYKTNADGNITWIISLQSKDEYTYTYDANGFLQKNTAKSFGGGTSSDTYTVSGDNYVSSVDGTGNLSTYEYYTDKENKGIYPDILTMAMGNLQFGKRSKNMLKKRTRQLGADVLQISYTYQYDTKGFPTKITTSSVLNSGTPNVKDTDYTYTCE